jgi:tripartite-type tricarboxylate transporter receptor subunit TctC
MSSTRISGTMLLAFAFIVAAFGTAAAQTYPARPIKMIVPFTPGGPVDVAARIVAQQLPRSLGQSVVIENRAGAAGAIGAKAVVSAEPDGYTLLCGNISTLVVVPVVTGNRDYDPARQFVPIAKVSQNHEVLVVRAASPAKSVGDLIAYAKASPGKLNFGSAGVGGVTHLAAELFKLRTGTDIVHVPYKGASDAVTALLGAQVDMFFGDISGVVPLLQDGALRALGVSSEARNPLVPDVPTMIESGVPDYVVSTAGRHVSGQHRKAQRGDQRQPHLARGHGRIRQARRRDKTGLAPGPRGISCCGDAEMDAGRQGRQHQARVAR